MAKAQAAPQLRGKKNKGHAITCSNEVGILIAILCLAAVGMLYEFSSSTSPLPSGSSSLRRAAESSSSAQQADGMMPAPPMPIFAPVPNAAQLMEDAYAGKPTLGGIMAIMQKYIYDLHMMNHRLAKKKAHRVEIIHDLFSLTETQLGRLDDVYSGKPIFPIREDDSVFFSLAAFREHLLAPTMVQAFSKAKNPDKIFVGAVVQNCFGKVGEDGHTIDTSGLPCRTGHQVVGKDAQGHDMTKVSDAPPDKNGIEEFCAMPDYKKYCDNGQVRVLYVHDTDALGPAMARYYASKLWAGETYFMQTDSHLLFAQDWDAKYRGELQATGNYPKSILSSYPPGFDGGDGEEVRESPGARLCACMTRLEDPNPIVRINTGVGYHGSEPRPTQIPFMAAGFFFTRGEFLVDVPFDPYMPWLFMGEELALSIRSWTHGWVMYAPRINWIAHHYRPGRLGLPKFWEPVNNLFEGSTGNNRLQEPVINRVKHLLGYPEALGKIQEEQMEVVLTGFDTYGLGKEKTREEYMEYAHMKIDLAHNAIMCSTNTWCNQGTKE